MSAFRLTSIRVARVARTPAFAASRRPFHLSSVTAVGKESKIHDENRAQEAEDAKQEQLKAQKEGKGKWTETLASDSESIVKADKNQMDTSKDTIAELQKESVKAAQQKK